MPRTILVINAGSSSLKLALYDETADRLLASAQAERLGQPEARLTCQLPDKTHEPLPQPADHASALDTALERFQEQGLTSDGLLGIGHRVVHGGEAFSDSVRIDDRVCAAIDRCSQLAPLHNPHNLSAIEAMRKRYPSVPQVAVFDTAFHQTLPRRAFLYGLPHGFYEEHGVRRYGFHGTSHRYMLQQTADRLGRPAEKTSLISAHLGNGCSITAIRNGRSVDTSMGLTPLEGLVMGTRSGDLDPSLFDFMARRGMDAGTLHNTLNQSSGLLGLSGRSNDMRTLLEAAEGGDERAETAVDVFCFRLGRYIGAMMASLDRLDALVFTGGIGENSADIRARTLAPLGLLGFSVDDAANACHGRDSNGRIERAGSHRVLVLPTEEERLIARDTRELVRA